VSVVRRIQRLVLCAVVVLALLAAGLLSVPYFVADLDIQAALSQSLASLTGDTPQIEGKARLSLLPRPVIRVGSIRFAATEAAFSADSLTATVRLLPLILGRIEIGALVVERPQLRLEIDQEGVRIVGFPLHLVAGNGGRRPDIRIVDGVAELQGASGQRERLTALNGVVSPSDEFGAWMSFRWREVPVSATLLIADPAALADGGRSQFRARLDAEPLRLAFDGGLAFRKGFQAEGALSAEANSARAALLWAQIEPPTQGGFGPFSLRAQAALTPAGLSLSPITLDLDGNRTQGALTLSRDGSRTLVQGTLASESVDFSPYAEAFSIKEPDGRAWSEARLDVKALRSLDLDLRLSAGKILFNRTELERVAVGAALRGGRFSVSVGDAQVFGGALRGAATIAPTVNGAEIKLEANLKDFDAAKGLAELAGIRRMEGRATLSLSLNGAGPSVVAIARSLRGEAQLSAANGALAGINVEQVLRRLELRPAAFGGGDVRGGRTPFDRFTARLEVKDGNANVRTAEMQNAAVRVTLSGLASIPARHFDLRGTASLVGPAASGGADSTTFELPFLLRGSWDDPSLAPDPAALIRRSEASPR